MKKLLVGLVAAMGVMATGLAFGAIPDSGGVIHGCYKNVGDNRLIVVEDVCPEGYTSLNWNQIGPLGPQGTQGVPGPQGDPGPAGTVISDELSTGPVTLPASSTYMPVASFTWTQDSGRMNMLVGGITITTPTVCTNSGGNFPTGRVLLRYKVDGAPALWLQMDVNQLSLGASSARSLGELGLPNGSGPINWPVWIFESSTDTIHTLTIEAQNANCRNNSGTGELITIDNLSFNVVSVG